MVRADWEVSLLQLTVRRGIKYKVTRRLPQVYISEIKIFSDKQKALQCLLEWLQQGR